MNQLMSVILALVDI